MQHSYKFILIFIFMFSIAVSAKESSINGIIIVEEKDGTILYNIAKRQVPSEALLDHFNRLVINEGRDVPVTIMFEDKVPLNVILNLRGIIGKAGLANIKQYTYNPVTRKMVEVILKGPAIDVLSTRVEEIFDMEKGEIYSPGKYKRLIKPRNVFCYWAVRELGITAKSLAEKLGITQSGVSKSVLRGKGIVEEMNLKIVE